MEEILNTCAKFMNGYKKQNGTHCVPNCHKALI